MKHKILLIEDNEVDIELISMALEDNGYLSFDLETALDGEQGLEKIKENVPDIILLDLNLPRKNGLEILEEIKSNEEFAAIPIIILTNSSSPNDVNQAYANHCNAYIRKPVGFNKLVDALKLTKEFWLQLVTLDI